MSTDFFDEDLIRTTRPGSTLRPRLDGETLDVTAEKKRLRSHQDAIVDQLTGSARQLEELRLQRIELERARADIETLGRRQEDYARRRREVLTRMDRGLESLDRREQEAARLIELIEAVRQRFQAARADVEGLNEEAWGGEGFADQLAEGLEHVERAETVYEAGQSKLQAGDWSLLPAGGGRDRGTVGGMISGGSEAKLPGFGVWLKAGLAFSLPLAVLLVALGAAFWWLVMRGGV